MHFWVHKRLHLYSAHTHLPHLSLSVQFLLLWTKLGEETILFDFHVQTVLSLILQTVCVFPIF